MNQLDFLSYTFFLECLTISFLFSIMKQMYHLGFMTHKQVSCDNN